MPISIMQWPIDQLIDLVGAQAISMPLQWRGRVSGWAADQIAAWKGVGRAAPRLDHPQRRRVL